MNVLKAGVLALALSVGSLGIMDSAEAARVGGGRSIGAQRSIAQRQLSPPPQQGQQAAQAATQARQNMGPLAGLAAGLGLGWLFTQGGMGPMLLGLLVVAAAIGLIMMMGRREQQAHPAPAMSMSQTHYAGLGNETVAAPPPSQMPEGDWIGAMPSARPNVPAGFDITAFVKQAKINFIRLQEAHDRAELEALREVTTPALYEQLVRDIGLRTAPQRTEVVTLAASLLEVVREGETYWASLHFSGQMRESAGATPAPFVETWHLSKPVSGDCGWLVSGIESLS